MAKCINCGADNRPGAKFCCECGKPQVVPVTTTPLEDEPQETVILPQPEGPGNTVPFAQPQLEQPAPAGVSYTPAEPPAPAPLVAPEGRNAVHPAVVPPVSPIAEGPVMQQPMVEGTQVFSDMLHNRYTILRQLGKGGMGAVYLAEDLTLFGRQCIVKEMLPYYSTEEEKQQAERFFIREVQLLSTLKHPGIPQVFDHFIINDHYYYVMEYVEGETLAARATRMGGRLSETEVLIYTRQIIDVLDYISSQPEPVVHRDIKPENLILDQTTNAVKLVDFGLAKAGLGVHVIDGQSSAAMGTPGYAPPEQYQGKSEPRSDIYALGATMHHMLTGCDPRPPRVLFTYPPIRQVNPAVSEVTENLVAQMVQVPVNARPTAKDLKVAFTTGKLPNNQVVQRGRFLRPWHAFYIPVGRNCPKRAGAGREMRAILGRRCVPHVPGAFRIVAAGPGPGRLRPGVYVTSPAHV